MFPKYHGSLMHCLFQYLHKILTEQILVHKKATATFSTSELSFDPNTPFMRYKVVMKNVLF